MSASVGRPRAVIVLVAGERRCVLAAIEHGVSCDLDLVHRLLSLRLSARRHGWDLVLEAVDHDLDDLLDLVGVATWLKAR